MCSTITDIAHRLHEYRKKLNKTQEEMGQSLDVSQSQYNKLENGQHIISFHSLQYFRKEGGDVYYLITGKEYQPGILDNYIEQCHTSQEAAQFLKLIIWVTEQGMNKVNFHEKRELTQMWKYISLAENEYILENICKWQNLWILISNVIADLKKCSACQMPPYWRHCTKSFRIPPYCF